MDQDGQSSPRIQFSKSTQQHSRNRYTRIYHYTEFCFRHNFRLKDGSSQISYGPYNMAEHDLAGPFEMIDSINHMKVSMNHFFGTHKWNQLVWVRFEAKAYC